MKTLYFVTGNKKKFNEAKHILSNVNLKQIKIDLPELQGSPEEVAKEKAKLAYNKVKKPLFVDDTGVAFHALGGMPGIYIKYFLEALKPQGLTRLLYGFKNKSATAFATIGYADGKVTKTFLGSIEGKIVSPKGILFGWDPVFKPNGYSKTFGQMSKEEKSSVSHRAKALKKLEIYLRKN